MLVRNIAQLAVYKTDKNTEALPLACLRGLFTEKASDIIYIIVERKLYGIICLEDILYHSDRNRVQINKRFISLIGYNVIEAHEIFKRRADINKIPIVNGQGELLGDYSRWDDGLFIERNQKRLMQKASLQKLVLPYEAVYVMEPVENGNPNFLCLVKYLDCFQIKYTVLKKAHIGEKISEKAIFIFLNEDERRGGQCVYRIAHCESDDQKKDALVKRGGGKTDYLQESAGSNNGRFLVGGTWNKETCKSFCTYSE